MSKGSLFQVSGSGKSISDTRKNSAKSCRPAKHCILNPVLLKLELYRRRRRGA
jgi:hypothetical protein